MPKNDENLWPDDLDLDYEADTTEPSPKLILREQASALGELTHNIVKAIVRTKTVGNEFVHTFFILAPIVNYRDSLFTVSHKLGGYPATITWSHYRTPKTVKKYNEFKKALQAIFSDDSTKRTIRQLVSESKTTDRPFFLVEDDEVVADAMTLDEAVRRARAIVGQDSEITIYNESKIVFYVRNFNNRIILEKVAESVDTLIVEKVGDGEKAPDAEKVVGDEEGTGGEEVADAEKVDPSEDNKVPGGEDAPDAKASS